MAETEEKEDRRDELLRIADNCEWVSENPPRTFREAIQFWYFVTHIVTIESNGHSVSHGRFDQYLHPYYQKDLAEGTLTKDFAQELIECALLKVQELTKLRDRKTTEANGGGGLGGQTFTLGGVDSEGADVTNDLTYMVIDAIPHVRLYMPWNAVRLHKNSPEDLWRKVAKVIKIGMGEPKIFNDDVVIPAMTNAGRTLEDARDYSVVGCVEVDAGGREYGWHDAAYFSMAKVLELAINNGKCLGCT
jgi:pyruvate-formate lyase